MDLDADGLDASSFRFYLLFSGEIFKPLYGGELLSGISFPLVTCKFGFNSSIIGYGERGMS